MERSRSRNVGSLPAQFLLKLSCMISKKYLVLTQIDGQIKMLSLTTNAVGRRTLRDRARAMILELFAGRRVGQCIVRPWPLPAER